MLWNSLLMISLPEPNTDFVALSAGVGYYLALRKDGRILGWGWKGFPGPTKAPEPNRDFVDVAATLESSYGVKKDGSIVAWGRCPPPFPRKR